MEWDQKEGDGLWASINQRDLFPGRWSVIHYDEERVLVLYGILGNSGGVGGSFPQLSSRLLSDHESSAAYEEGFRQKKKKKKKKGIDAI